MYPQGGILTRPQGHLLLVSLAFVERGPDQARSALEALRGVVEKELTSDLDDMDSSTPKDVPSAETGELGMRDDYYRYFLTITLGISRSGFDALGLPPEEIPGDLIDIPWAQLGDTPSDPAQGDLVLQVCSDNVYINEHVARRIEEELGAHFTVVWTQLGVQRHNSTAGRVSRGEGRALIGFLDGTSNLDPRNDRDDAALVFVEPASVSEYPPLPPSQPGSSGGYPGAGPTFPSDLRPPPASEPDWTKGGTYMVVRASANEITSWDDQTLGAQEQAIGRFKFSGASLDLADEPHLAETEPAFGANQGDLRVALDSHVRKMNPRRSEEDLVRRIFRRGYPLIEATADGMRRGLVFVAFGRTISTQFEFIVRAWMINPDFPQPGTGVDRLRAFDQQVLVGGYFFVPPLQYKTKPWSWMVGSIKGDD